MSATVTYGPTLTKLVVKCVLSLPKPAAWAKPGPPSYNIPDYYLENFVGRDCSISRGLTTTHLPEASENKPTDWHQICRRSGQSVSHLLVCCIPFLCRCVYSCLSRFDPNAIHQYSPEVLIEV